MYEGLPIVYVVWHDASSNDEWEKKTDAIEHTTSILPIHTVGWLVDDGEDRILVASSHDRTYDNVGGRWMIPRCQIEDMWFIDLK